VDTSRPSPRTNWTRPYGFARKTCCEGRPQTEADLSYFCEQKTALRLLDYNRPARGHVQAIKVLTRTRIDSPALPRNAFSWFAARRKLFLPLRHQLACGSMRQVARQRPSIFRRRITLLCVRLQVDKRSRITCLGAGTYPSYAALAASPVFQTLFPQAKSAKAAGFHASSLSSELESHVASNGQATCHSNSCDASGESERHADASGWAADLPDSPLHKSCALTSSDIKADQRDELQHDPCASAGSSEDTGGSLCSRDGETGNQ
jgi:hypothetical protein